MDSLVSLALDVFDVSIRERNVNIKRKAGGQGDGIQGTLR